VTWTWVGDLDLGVQPKLLMVLEERRFRRLGDVRDRRADVRLIAATHHDLSARVQQGRFRSDLYFRINTLHLRVPALRERPEDVPILARHLLARICAALDRPRVELSEAAARKLSAHSWPGNVRQLRNVLERSVLLSGGERLLPEDLLFSDLPAAIPSGDEHDLTLQEMERLHIQRTLEREGGHVARAAARLDVPLSSLYQKIRKHRLRRPNPGEPPGDRPADRKR
jgi:DNA-binding NtrC family response regulator